MKRYLLKRFCVCGFMIFTIFPEKWVFPADARALDAVYLKNKDRISGIIIKNTDEIVIVKTDAAGTVVIDKDFISELVTFASEDTAEDIAALDSPVENSTEKNPIRIGINHAD